MNPSDKKYIGLPWKRGGRTWAGVDCAGLAELFLREEIGLAITAPDTAVEKSEQHATCEAFLRTARPEKDRGDIVFFRHRKNNRLHCVIFLGDNKYLHIVAGCASRIENGTTLLTRLGLVKLGALGFEETQKLGLLLHNETVGDVTSVVLFVLSIALSLAASFLNRTKPPQLRNDSGIYGFDSLITQSTPELPLPDLIGSVTVAGNCPFTSAIDKNLVVDDSTSQGANRVVVLCSGPINDLPEPGFNIFINGLAANNKHFHSINPGFGINPAQTKSAAVLGNINSTINVSNLTIYPGTYDVSVPTDIRASYDRNFPVYGFNGCAYIVFRLINPAIFPNFNMTAVVQGRPCRTYDSSGFTRSTVTDTMTADGVAVRFKLTNTDIESITELSVDGTDYTLLSATNQSGNIFWINKTKGYVEFLTPPSDTASISVEYVYFPRLWTQNPADHLVYLLTEPIRGKGFPEQQVDFDSAVALQTFCNANITWRNSDGTFVQPRYTCNYAIDFRKNVQDHIQAVLDACYSALYQSNGKWIVKARAAADPFMSFDEGNIIAGSFSSEKTDRSTRFNRVHIVYNPATTYNAQDDAPRDDLVDQRARAPKIGNNGIVETSITAPAIDNKVQAERAGETILREDLNSRYVVTLTTNIQGLALEPMDIVGVTHSSQPTWNDKPFRVENIDYDGQDQLVLTLSEYFEGAYL